MLARSARATLASASRLFSTAAPAGNAVAEASRGGGGGYDSGRDTAGTALAKGTRRGRGGEGGRDTAGTAVAKATGGGGGGDGGRDTLGRRLLSLVYTKRSAVVTIRKWKEERRTVRKYELNRIVRELRKLKRYKHALEIHEWMPLQKDIKLQPGDYAVHLDLIAKIRGLNSAEKFFEDIPDKMRGHEVCTSLLHTYVQNNLSDKAEALFQKMSECEFIKSPLPYNHMLTMYISKVQLEKVPVLIKKLKLNTSPDIVTYNLWLTALASQNDVEAAEKVFLQLKKENLEPDWVTYSVLTNLYIKKEHHEKAKLSLTEMEKRATKKNRVAFASLISLYGNSHDKDGVNRTWKKMKSLFRKMNDAEYMSMISSLVKLGDFAEAQKLYAEWESVSGTGDSRIPNIILAEYINREQIVTAENFFQQMVQKGITPSYSTWEILTWAYLKLKQMSRVLDCFKKAIGSVKKWTPNLRLVREVCKELEDEGNIKGAEEFLETVRKGGHVSTELYNSVLRTYAKAGKMPLIVEERMVRDGVEMDEEARELITLTSRMCVTEVSSSFS